MARRDTSPQTVAAVWAIVLLAATAGLGLLVGATGGSAADASPLVILIAWLPSLLALVVALAVGGLHGLRDLTRQLLRWRAAPGWYALAVLGPFAFVFIAVVVVKALGIESSGSSSAWFALPGIAILGPLFAGSFGEELGWRGFGQPRLEPRFGLIGAAVTIGLLWAAWHLWPVLTPAGGESFDPTDALVNSVRLVAMAIVYAWLYRTSGAALGVVMTAHAAHNVAITMLPPQVADTPAASVVVAALYVLAAAAVTATVTRSAHRSPA